MEKGKMKKYEVTIQLISGKISVEIYAFENSTMDEIYDLAVAEIEKELMISKLDSYREVKD